MTYKEAIEFFKNVNIAPDLESIVKCSEIINMAIEALEKQSKIKTIMLTKGGEYKYTALMDCQRQLIYDRWITVEMASALGWDWSDEE